MTICRARDPMRGPVWGSRPWVGPKRARPKVAKKVCVRSLAAQYLGGLKSFGPLGDLELDFLALLQ